MSKFCLAVVAFLVFTMGCKSSTDSTGSNNTLPKTLSAPGVGSVFIYHYYHLNSTGAKVDSSRQFDTVVVIATGISQFGRSNVMQIRDDGKIPIYMIFTGLFANYDSTGNVSFYFAGQQKGWFTAPIESKGQTSFVEKDTTINGSRETDIATRTYSGPTSLTLAGKSFEAAVFSLQDELLTGTTAPSKEYFDTKLGILLRIDITGKSSQDDSRYELLSADFK